MSRVTELENDGQWQAQLSGAGARLVVVDFFATWCGPCRRIAPAFVQFSQKYPTAVFLKVDVEKCQETAAANNVRSMPTFLLFRSKVKIDSQQGADPNALEDKIKKWVAADGESADGPAAAYPGGHMDLTTFVSKGGSECLNESDEHPFTDCLNSSPGSYLQSDCDEQLILSLAFNQTVKLHSLKIKAPEDSGPKTIKLFINQPRTLDFDSADSMEPIQTLTLTENDVLEGSLSTLKFVKLQNVQNLTLFFKDNLGGKETTQIGHLCVIGSPVNQTNMSDFKRVAGKKGESH